MEKYVDVIYECKINELVELDFPLDIPFGLVVNYDDVKYEFVIHLKSKSDKLLVLGSGQIERGYEDKFKNKPLFSRVTWPYKQSTIYYNDPTRYMGEGVELGGYGLGTENSWYLKNISIIIRLISLKVYDYESGDEFKNMILYGSSQGGFLSLQLSTLIRNSTCISEIPILDVRDMVEWENLKNCLFKELTMDKFNEKFSHRTSCIDLMIKEKYIPNAYLILDCSAIFDFDNQYSKFFNRLTELPFSENKNNIKIRIDGKNQGHMQLTFTNAHKLIENVSLLMDMDYKERDMITREYFTWGRLSFKQFSLLTKYSIARIDLKNFGDSNNSIEIISSSDKLITSFKPEWFCNDEGIGIVNQSSAGVLDLKIKCINDGLLRIALRGIFKEGPNGTIPIYIDFTKLKIDNKTIFNGHNIVWHDEPYIFEKKVKNSDVINIHVEWLPIS